MKSTIKKAFIFLIISQGCLAQSDCIVKASANPSMPSESFSYSGVPIDMKVTNDNGIIIAPIGDGRSIKKYKNGAWSNLVEVSARCFDMKFVEDSDGIIYYLYENSDHVPIPAIEKYSDGKSTKISPSFFSSVNDAGNYQIVTDNSNNVFAAYVVNQNPHIFKYIASKDSWSDVSGIISTKSVINIQLQADKTGNIYMGFLELINNAYQYRVYSYSGSNWSEVGSGELSNGASFSFKIDNSGKPNIAKFGNEKLSLLKFENGQWDTTSHINYPGALLTQLVLAFDSKNTPYFAFANSKQKLKVTVLKSTSWDTLGTLNVYSNNDYSTASTMEFKLDNDDIPQLFFKERSVGGQHKLLQYKEGAWKLAGNSGLLDQAIMKTTIAKDTSDNIYLLGSQYDGDGRTNLYRYMGDSLMLIGDAGITTGNSSIPKMTIAPDNKIWLVSQEYSSFNYKITAKTYAHGTWSTVGTNLSIGEAQYLTISMLDSIPYIGYGDKGNQKRVYIKRYKNKQWESVGGEPVSIAEGRDISITSDKDGIPYICYQEADNDKGITIKKLLNESWVEITSPKLGFIYGTVIFKISPDNIPYIAFSETDGVQLMRFQDNQWTFVRNGNVLYEGVVQDLTFDDQNRPVVAHSDWYSPTGSTKVSKLIDDKWTLVYKADHGGESIWSMNLLRRNRKIFVKEESYWVRFVEIDPDCIVLGNKYDESRESKQEISFYPNPGNSIVNFVNINSPYTLRILDVNGSEKGKFQLSPVHTSIDAQFLPSGIYFFLFESPDNSRFSKKFIKL